MLDQEHLLPIECRDAGDPAAGISTEPARITRTWTNQRSSERFNLRPWKNGTHAVVSLGKYIAWIPTPAAEGPILKLTLEMSPASSLVNGIPRAMTFDRWMAGDRSEALTVSIEANCATRDPATPRFRRIRN